MIYFTGRLYDYLPILPPKYNQIYAGIVKRIKHYIILTQIGGYRWTQRKQSPSRWCSGHELRAQPAFANCYICPYDAIQGAVPTHTVVSYQIVPG